jgi:class 3 adenylate cyclase
MYVRSRLGSSDILFDGVPYPTDRYSTPDDFFLNEDEWTTYETFQNIIRKAKDLVGEKYFYFNCGASSARLRSWGRFNHFVRVFASPSDGFKRLPFFNKNFNDTKEIEVIAPPTYDKTLGKIRTVLRIQFHSDFDVNRDYIGDPYLRGIISSIPTIWGLSPATVKQPVNPYDPEILFNREPEFVPFGLNAKMEKDLLTIKDPIDGQRKIVGKKILIDPELLSKQDISQGKTDELPRDYSVNMGDRKEAILITETVQADNWVILKAGEIFKSPYFILDVTYNRFSLVNRVSQFYKTPRSREESGDGLIETINRLRENIEARNEAYHALEQANNELREAKERIEDYSKNLEKKVEERTIELSRAQEKLMVFNQNLKAEVKEKVKELERYNELRRYLSPKLTEKILSAGETLGTESQRRMMTVVFSDIRNFSALTDSLEPEEIFFLLDRYLSEMTKIIHQYDGTLNKIIGDGLLVFFGDPIPVNDHAQRAVMMATAMQKKVAELGPEWLQYGHELGIGIGINTGYMTVGNIGSEMHRDYTVIGNQVNVAARLESLAKPGQILISQRTYSRVKEFVEVEKVGEIKVKGIHHPIVPYNVRV